MKRVLKTLFWGAIAFLTAYGLVFVMTRILIKVTQ